MSQLLASQLLKMLAASSMMDATKKASNPSFYPSLPPAFPNNPPNFPSPIPAAFLPFLAGTEIDNMLQNKGLPPQAIFTSYQDFNNFTYSYQNAAACDVEETKVFSSCQHSNISNNTANFNSQDYQNLEPPNLIIDEFELERQAYSSPSQGGNSIGFNRQDSVSSLCDYSSYDSKEGKGYHQTIRGRKKSLSNDPVKNKKREQANMQERKRMRKQNYELDRLRRYVRHIRPRAGPKSKIYVKNKLSKIVTLTSATRYMALLIHAADCEVCDSQVNEYLKQRQAYDIYGAIGDAHQSMPYDEETLVTKLEAILERDCFKCFCELNRIKGK